MPCTKSQKVSFSLLQTVLAQQGNNLWGGGGEGTNFKSLNRVKSILITRILDLETI